MKKTYRNLLFLLGVAASLPACDNFMDVHKKYLEDGEKIYAPIVDSFSFQPGREKILAGFRLYNSPHVREIQISWNGERGDTALSIPVTPDTEYYSAEYLLNIPEGSYTFDVRTKDVYDNLSIKVTGFCDSYGDVYQSTLRTQNIGEVTFAPEQAEISWRTTPVNHIGNEVRYTNVRSETKTVFSGTGAPAPSVVLPEAKSGTTFEYRSLFLPAASSIDTFYTLWTEYEIPFPFPEPEPLPEVELDRSIMSIVRLDSDSDWGGYGGTAEGIIDGVTVTTGSDNGTFGHTHTGGLPAAITVDLGQTVKLSSIVLHQHRSAEVPFTWVNTRKFEVYGRTEAPAQSGDWTEWTKLMECEIVPPSSGNWVTAANAGAVFAFPQNMEAVRYIRVNVTESFDSASMGGITHIAELTFRVFITDDE
jgi:hypothetical protein